ncbi:amidohydrolase family protein [Nitrosococcus halophilus]|uniref:amidohydrolase family protein n=1 Tax=Nitrosococcus halophilus TaxID=133539 RepID=UPI0006749C22|nr:amidohydrolase family protein [Nitrosococcus halophilus]
MNALTTSENRASLPKVALLLGWLFGVCIAAPTHAERLIAFTGGTVMDGTGAPPIPDGTVLVAGERITAVGPSSEIDLPKDTQVIDARGKWIIPGLIDAHVHFFQSGGLYTRPDIIDLRAERPYSQEMAWIRERLPQTLARYLASGVTSVVDMGGPLWTFEVRQWAQESLLAPRVAVAGPLLSGYKPAVFDLDDPPLIKVHSPQQARAAVRRLLPHQPDLIKLWLVQRPSQSLMAKELRYRRIKGNCLIKKQAVARIEGVDRHGDI